MSYEMHKSNPIARTWPLQRMSSCHSVHSSICPFVHPKVGFLSDQ